MPPIQFRVDRREAGQTLAALLKSRLGLSWSQAKRLIERRHVKVSGQLETNAARRLQAGKRVELASGILPASLPEAKQTPSPQSSPPSPACTPARKPIRTPSASPAGPKTAATPPRPPRGGASNRSRPPRTTPHAANAPGSSQPSLTGNVSQPPLSPEALVYVDDAIVVVNKPAGLTTMRHAQEAAEFGERARRYLPKTLADYLPAMLGRPHQPLIAVHRIDRDTSGLVVFARTPQAAEHLTQQFRRHRVDRRYFALTRGVPATSRIESVFVRDRGDGRRGSTTDLLAPGGQRAVTHVQVREVLGRFALVECRLETGRTHQVRIHLGECGTPLCGETVYDRPLHGRPLADDSGALRPMLHAARLGFVHPETGERMSWEVAPPADFATLLQRLRNSLTESSPPMK
ncbi:MAG: RluA family pseudouridine synthase [Gemmataceae bacterium]|nr:pseudouridine synthase [Gemmata sp.]MDW8196103.1 RluA family pseudouridine synthase [Gemmataceae bacterium]